MKTVLLEGGVHSDQRGILRFVNDINPGYYRRFYLITHPDTTIVRAWQGHKQEEKAFYTISGSFIIGVVNPSNFQFPDDNEKPDFFYLTSENNHFLRVEGGCYTGIKALKPNSILLVLSSMDLASSKGDDFRQPENRWVKDWNLIN